MSLRLEDAVRRAVIPLLYTSQCDRAARPTGAAIDALAHRQASDHLFALALTGDAARQETYICKLRSDGVSLSALCHDILTPAMERIGNLWLEDEMSFAEVSIKTACLQQAFAAATAASRGNSAGSGQRAIVCVVPGEDHSFGASVLGSLLEDAGLTVDRLAKPGIEDLAEHLRSGSYRLLCISCGSERTLARLAETCAELRPLAAARGVAIAVGGWALQQPGNPVESFEADYVATDSRTAIADILRLVKAGPGGPM